MRKCLWHRVLPLFFDNLRTYCAREIGRLAKKGYKTLVAQSQDRAAVTPPAGAGWRLKHHPSHPSHPSHSVTPPARAG